MWVLLVGSLNLPLGSGADLHSARHVHVYDVRKMSEPQQRRESSLKHQTRCIRTFPDGTGYALSSVEGRVAIEYFDPSDEVQKQKYESEITRAAVTPFYLGTCSSAIAQL